MLNDVGIALIIVIVLALTFDFLNGFHDTANAIATSVATRVLRPQTAILMAAVLNFAGALVSTNVASTITKGIVVGTLPEYVIIAALVSAIIWNILTWYLGIPSSSSHALIGSLIGAAIAFTLSFDKIMWGDVLEKVIIPLVTSPFLGFVIGYFFMTLLYELLRKLSQATVNRWFSKIQIASAAFMAFSHGNNDAQKSMGIITMALLSAGVIQTATVPWEVMLGCAVAMGIGTSVGGRRIIKTMGVKMIKLQPVQGFAAETAAALVIQIASRIGAPVSTTQIISSSIMGVGASKRFSAVNWSVVSSIFKTWIFTIPVCMGMGALITFLIQLFIK